MAADFDIILQEISEFGRYQRMIVWLLCIPTCFVNAFNAFVFIFQAYTPEFLCVSSHTNMSIPNETVYSDQCYIENVSYQHVECEKYIYSRQYFQSTLITDFDLICDRSIVWKNILSFLNAVTIAGCFFYSYIQDRWGRKKCFIFSLFAYLFGGIASLFATDPIVFAALRTPWSLSGISTWNIGYIWALEYVGPSRRAYVTTVMSVLYGVAAVSLALLARFSRSWIDLGFMTTIPFIFLFSYYFFIDESPRWLLTQGKRKEAIKTLQKMARWQKKHPLKQEILESLLTDNHCDKLSETKSDSNNNNFVIFELFRHPNLRWKTLLITYTWISIAVVYNAIAYNVENLGGNLYLTYVMQAAMEIPANLLTLPLLNRFGRLRPLFLSMLASSAFSFLAIPAQYLAGELGVILAVAGSKFSICIGFCCIALLAGELYPTTLRGLGTGFSSAFGDMGNIFMPYIVHSARYYEMLPMIILGSLSILGALGCLFLPETKDAYLPETVDEAELHGLVRVSTFKTNFSKLFIWKRNDKERSPDN